MIEGVSFNFYLGDLASLPMYLLITSVKGGEVAIVSSVSMVTFSRLDFGH